MTDVVMVDVPGWGQVWMSPLFLSVARSWLRRNRAVRGRHLIGSDRHGGIDVFNDSQQTVVRHYLDGAITSRLDLVHELRVISARSVSDSWEAAMEKRYLEVPAGAFSRPCREESCKQLCYFVPKAKGGFDVVDCHADEHCKVPTETEPGRGVSHFVTCTAPNKFGRKTRRS